MMEEFAVAIAPGHAQLSLFVATEFRALASDERSAGFAPSGAASIAVQVRLSARARPERCETRHRDGEVLKKEVQGAEARIIRRVPRGGRLQAIGLAAGPCPGYAPSTRVDLASRRRMQPSHRAFQPRL
jgi:hypothetical protein